MISLISDVHIKRPGDEPSVLFLKFLNHDLVKKSEKIVLLGDIFDILVGGNTSFSKKHNEIFTKIENYLKEGKEVYYLEGNHDFHLDHFFKNLYDYDNFIFSTKKLKINENVLVCHGDDIEIENPEYKKYSNFIKSGTMKFIAQSVFPFSLTEAIANWVSSRSRKKNIEKYESKKEDIRLKFRRSAEEEFKTNTFEIIISGHSHIKDEYISPNGFTYLNNGYFPNEKTFIYLMDNTHQFINLD